jgi:hypothetical protein
MQDATVAPRLKSIRAVHVANFVIAEDSSEPVGLKPLTDSMRDRQLQLNTVACAIAGSCDCQNRC